MVDLSASRPQGECEGGFPKCSTYVTMDHPRYYDKLLLFLLYLSDELGHHSVACSWRFLPEDSKITLNIKEISFACIYGYDVL